VQSKIRAYIDNNSTKLNKRAEQGYFIVFVNAVEGELLAYSSVSRVEPHVKWSDVHLI
jgi:hypothetical protein